MILVVRWQLLVPEPQNAETPVSFTQSHAQVVSDRYRIFLPQTNLVDRIVMKSSSFPISFFRNQSAWMSALLFWWWSWSNEGRCITFDSSTAGVGHRWSSSWATSVQWPCASFTASYPAFSRCRLCRVFQHSISQYRFGLWSSMSEVRSSAYRGHLWCNEIFAIVIGVLWETNNGFPAKPLS